MVQVTGGFGGGTGTEKEKDVEKGEFQAQTTGGEIGVKRDIRVSNHQMARR